MTVSLATTTLEADIHYTLDGSEPTIASALYTGPFVIDTTSLLKAKAFKDGFLPSSTSSANFTIGSTTINIPPIVDAGEDRTVFINQTIALDGSETMDPDGNDDLLQDEQWTQLSGPPVMIEDPTEEIAYFTPLVAGVYEFQLEVSDGLDTGSDTVVFSVIDPQGCYASGPLALYKFEERSGTTIMDTSGVGVPLNLTVTSGNPTWLTGRGLQTDANTVIESTGPATKIIDAAKTSNAITIEAWVRATTITQDGPARIVTLSSSSTLRNIMLGQGNFGSTPPETYSVRLRTTDAANDNNGEPALITPNNTATGGLQHVVVTRAADGTTIVYVDGEAVASRSDSGTLANWDDYKLLLANEISGDRPWLGELHRVAIYSCGMIDADVSASYNVGVILVPTAIQGLQTSAQASNLPWLGVVVLLLVLTLLGWRAARKNRVAG